MRQYADPKQVLYAATLAGVVPSPPPAPDEAALLLDAGDFDSCLRDLHPGVALLCSQAVDEFVMASGGESGSYEARRRVRGGLYAGYSHGRACLGAVGASASVFLAIPEEVAACLEGVDVRLDPSLLRAVLRSETKVAWPPTTKRSTPD